MRQGRSRQSGPDGWPTRAQLAGPPRNMGKVIVDGEVMDASDPRAIRHREAAKASAPDSRPQSMYNGGASSGTSMLGRPGSRRPPSAESRSAAAAAAAGPPPAAGGDFLDRIAEPIGLRGRTVTLPAVGMLGMPPLPMRVITLALVLLVTVLVVGFDWRAAAGLSIFWYILANNQNARPAPRGPVTAEPEPLPRAAGRTPASGPVRRRGGLGTVASIRSDGMGGSAPQPRRGPPAGRPAAAPGHGGHDGDSAFPKGMGRRLG